ncbi:MAG: hypothetical protein OEV66_00810 [Spirochaetia bacterium]|nr:hypothetical protein [Spirochaetia bacterium]
MNKKENSDGKKSTDPVKSVSKEDNIKKAARIILSIGEENAASILKHLDADSIDKVVTEMIRMKNISEDEKTTILRDFKKNLDDSSASIHGGVNQAADFLEKTLGKERADKHISRVKERAIEIDLSEIEKYDPGNIAQIMAGEMPQTSSLILAAINPAYAAKILTSFNNAYRVSVARKIATMNKVSPEILRLAYQTVIDKVQKMESGRSHIIEGEKKLIEILNFMDQSVEDKILDNLDEEDPEMTARIKEKLRVFEDIIQLTTRELRKIFTVIPEHTVWAKALKGAGQNIISHVFASISMNRASDIMSEMNLIQKLPLKEIEGNRRIIMNVINKLEKEGKVVLRKDKEKLVE